MGGSGEDFPAQGDFILFIEEVGEPLHNLDRHINNLRLRGILSRCKGVILGDFVDCPPLRGASGDKMAPSAEALLAEYFRPYGIPVCCGLHSGHGDENYPLIMGAKVSLTVDSAGSSITFDIGGECRHHTIYLD